MRGPLGKSFYQALNHLVHLHLLLLFFSDYSLALFLGRLFLTSLQNSLIKAHSLRYSCLCIVTGTLFFMVYHLLVWNERSLMVDFLGRNKNTSIFFLWYLDLILAFCQLLRAVATPMNSWEIEISHPYIRYQPDETYLMNQNRDESETSAALYARNVSQIDSIIPILREPNELISIPTFEINFHGLIYGIIFGMRGIGVDSSASSIISHDQSLQDLRTSFRWRLMRLNRSLRQSSSSANLQSQGQLNLP